MERNRAAIESGQSEIQNPEVKISVRGHTDLALVTLNSSLHFNKFSGNSQRRKKNFLLFHGTFLLNFDLALVGEFLRMPSKQPDYRANRNHGDFLTNLKIPAPKIKSALAEIWNATDELQGFPQSRIQKLAGKNIQRDEWNFKL